MEYVNLLDQVFEEHVVLKRMGYKISRILAGRKAFVRLQDQYGDLEELVFDVESGTYIKAGFFVLDEDLTVHLNDTLKPSEIAFEAEKIDKIKRYISKD